MKDKRPDSKPIKPPRPPEDDSEKETGPESFDPRENAVRFKAFQYLFSEGDLKGTVDEKKISKKLKQTRNLEKSYANYIRDLELNPDKVMVFPWDNPFRRALFSISLWFPKVAKWVGVIIAALFVINYIPGPTQHIFEHIAARAIYDTARLQRLPDNLETYAHSANIVDAGGMTIKSYGKRSVTSFIPDRVKMALLACEDHYLLPHDKNSWYVNAFFIHAGVSWLNILGALKDNLFGRNRGASTIVMQNAKKILGNDKRSLANKLEEIVISYILVSRYGKDANLDFYVNTVPVGSNIYGFQAAAQNYFKKELDELNTLQLLTIASFIPNHNRKIAFYKIVKGHNLSELDDTMRGHARAGINKINSALEYLLNLGEITDSEYRAWHLEGEDSIRRIGLRDYRSPLYGEEEWTSWNVIKEVCSRDYLVNGRPIPGARLLLDEKGDVVIETKVDLELVEKIKEIIKEFLESPNFKAILRRRNLNTWQDDLQMYLDRNATPPYHTFTGFMNYLFHHINIGVMIINQQGEVMAYVGGKEFLSQDGSSDYDNGTFTEAGDNTNIIIDLMNKKARIAPSSTIKPLIAYYAMLDNDVNLDTKFADKPIEFKYSESVGRKIWLPRNSYGYDTKGTGRNRYLGREYSLLEAQILSINTIFARLYSERTVRDSVLIGFDRVNLDYNREDAKYWPFGIGASQVPVQQWLGIYNAFLDGYYRDPNLVTRILVNGQVIYDRQNDEDLKPIALFDSKKERDEAMRALYEICNRGTGQAMESEFTYYRNLVSGKTGTSPSGHSSLFVSHFNPYRNRTQHQDKNMTMVVAVTTNTGGKKSVGTSTQGPVKIAGQIYDYLYKKELAAMMDAKIEEAKTRDINFRNNHIYWANANRYMEKLLHEKRGDHYIHQCLNGVDNYQEAMEQILNSSNKIYRGRDDLFYQLVDYYCDQEKLVKIVSQPIDPEEEN